MSRYQSIIPDKNLCEWLRAQLERVMPRLEACRTDRSKRCQLPLCDYCAKQRAKRDSRRLLHRMNDASNKKLFSIVLTSPAEKVVEGMRFLAESVTRLRRMRVFSNARGGLFFRDVSCHPNHILFLPHVHGVVELDSPILESDLGNAWDFASRGTRGASSGIKQVRSVPKTASYTTKRCLVDLLNLDDHALLNIAGYQLGARRLSWFGGWRGFNTPKPTRDNSPKREPSDA